MSTDSHDYDEPVERPSKTRLKLEAKEITTLGETLAELSTKDLNALALPENIVDTIAQLKRMSKRDSARKRVVQYLGKLLRRSDLDEIKQRLQKIRQNRTILPHLLVNCFDCFTQKDEEHWEEFLVQFPTFDRQLIRQLLRLILQNPGLPQPRDKLKTYIRTHIEAQIFNANDPGGATLI